MPPMRSQHPTSMQLVEYKLMIGIVNLRAMIEHENVDNYQLNHKNKEITIALHVNKNNHSYSLQQNIRKLLGCKLL